ncbi:MAG TPA: alpha/beta hydrolase [Candidatus Avimonas sp.]|nr:alpha/beta hydrolase [Clostridiales bacterium]HPU57946.1 alpha/beta hydrolase [Candidatus Avimonas sp.]
MKHQVIDIKVDYKAAGLEGSAEPKLYTYIIDHSPEMDYHKKRPAIVICPGGGYAMTSDREAEPIALRFNALGFQAFVLRYSVNQVIFPGALLELSKAVSIVRENAKEWDIDPEKIVVCGFSAGGHLAASLGVFWNRDFVTKPLGFANQENKPNGMILSYPVITSGEFAHVGSLKNLLKDKYDTDPELLSLVSLEKQVSQDTPPAFIWHTFDDAVVPVENALVLAAEMKKQNIPFELHILPKGIHGLSLATMETGFYQESCCGWPDMAARWVREMLG